MKIYVCGCSKHCLDDIICVTTEYAEIMPIIDTGSGQFRSFEIDVTDTSQYRKIESLTHTCEELRQMNDSLAEENYRLRETIVQMAMEAHGK